MAEEAREQRAAVRVEERSRLRARAREDDVSALRDYVEVRGTVPHICAFLGFLGVYHQTLAGRWPEGWDALYGAAGYERVDGRRHPPQGRALTPEHRSRIAEGVRRQWADRRRNQEEVV